MSRRIKDVFNRLPRRARGRLLDNMRRTAYQSGKLLTAARRAVLLGVSADMHGPVVEFTPGHPRNEHGALTYFSPVHVECGDVHWSGGKVTDGVGLFSSQHFFFARPAVELDFKLLEPGKKHLVEMSIGLAQKNEPFHFRVAVSPGVGYQDVTISNQGPLYALVEPLDGYEGDYWVSFRQMDTKSGPLRSWLFHSIQVTTTG